MKFALRPIDTKALAELSVREEQVLKLAASGYLDKEIGLELGVSLNTLRTYWTRIRAKVGEGSRTALAAAYIERNSRESGEDSGPFEWELDLRRNIWRKLSDRIMPMGVGVGVEIGLEEMFEHFHPDDRSGIRELLESVTHDTLDEFSFTARLLTSEGPRQTSAYVRVIRDEQGTAVKLLGRRSRILNLGPPPIQSITVGYWQRDMETGELKGDEAFKRILGIEGNPPDFRAAALKRFHPDDFELANNFVVKAIAAGQTQARCTHRLKARSGGYHWVTTHVRIEYPENGPPIVLGTVMGFN